MKTDLVKHIGLIGGLGPESTLDYYRGIINRFKAGYDQTGYPEILIDSVNLKACLDLAKAGKWDEIADAMSTKLENLKSIGADIGAIASNTPHKVFEQIQAATTLPLVSIVTATADYAVQHDLKRVLLLGTLFTMEADFYPNEFSIRDIETIIPDEPERNFLQKKIFSELEWGVILPETKRGILRIIQNADKQHHVDGVIMGCTELPMIISDSDIEPVYINTTDIHINAIVAASKSSH